MSQSSLTAEIVAAYEADLVVAFISCVTTTLVVYEYIITMNKEIKVIWRRNWTLITWMFISNRYLLIASVIWTVSPATAKVLCHPAIIVGNVIFMAQYSIFAAFATLRVFVIWDRSLPVALFILLLNLVPIGTNICAFILATVTYTADPVLGTFCESAMSTQNVPDAATLHFYLSLGTRLALIISDTVILALTWRKTFTHRMEAARIGVETPLSDLLLRDGTVYFGALLAMNISQVVMKSVPSLLGHGDSTVGNIIQVLEPIFISRFLLNLRNLRERRNEIQDAFVGNSPSSISRFHVPRFRVPTLASVIGNIGEELDHECEDELDDGIDASSLCDSGRRSEYIREDPQEI